MKQSIEQKTGSAPIEKVGHTYSGVFGMEPMAKTKGRTVTPTPITFGK